MCRELWYEHLSTRYTRCGTIGLAANGTVTVREVTEAAGHRCGSDPPRNSGQRLPVTTADFQPVWTAQGYVEDFRLAVRGRLALGSWIVSLPWHLFRGLATFLRRMFPPRMG